MPSIAPYADAGGDSFVARDGDSSWATARSATTGTSVNDYTTASVVDAQKDGGLYYLRRAFLSFDTSSIPDNNEPTAATLYVWVYTKDQSGQSSSVCLVAGSQASPTALTVDDFDACGTVELSARRAISDLTVGAYNAFPLNAAGLAAINKSGFTKLCLRQSRDLDDSDPPAQSWGVVGIRTTEQSGTSNDPYLEVTYAEVQRTGGDNLGWSDGTAQALDKADGSKQRWGFDALAWQDSPAVYWRAARSVRTVAPAGPNTTLNGSHTLPQSTITVVSTAGFPDSGTIYLHDPTFPYRISEVTYTGKTATTFTGCSGGAGAYGGNGIYASGKPVVSRNAENSFPEILQFGGSDPELLVSYMAKPAHSAKLGSQLRLRSSTDGGLTWGDEGTILTAVQNPGSGIAGHSHLLCSDGSHFVAWSEPVWPDPDTYPAYVCKSYSIRCPAGLDPANPANWSTPVEIPTKYGADYMAVGNTGVLEHEGEIYLVAMGVDSTPYTGANHYSKLLKTTDKGATGGNWSVVGTIATLAQTDGRANGEGSLVVLPGNIWISHLRCEVTAAYTTLDRYQAKSTDNGATWSGHTRIAQNLVNSSGTIRRQSGMVISQGGSASGTPTKTIFTADINDWSGPSSGVTTEPAQSPYIYYVGSEFAAVEPFGAFDAVNAFAGENNQQSGAQVYFQWYEIPGLRYGSDTLAWTDSASRTTTVGKTGADSLTFTDGATGSNPPLARSGADALTWTDSGTRTSGTKQRTGVDTLAWTDAASRSVAAGAAVTYSLPLTADFVSAGDQTANFVSAGDLTADFIAAPID